MKRPAFRWKGLLATVAVFVAAMSLLTFLMGRAGRTTGREQAALLERAIRNAAVSSYATEGAYPATLAQLIDEYGILVDGERFFVRYDVFASNVMPDISIIALGEVSR